jgi:hypothetical protein
MSSSDLPLVSGMYAASTATVPSSRNPNKKYAPYADLWSNMGVNIATSQFVKKPSPCATQFAAALVLLGWISLA